MSQRPSFYVADGDELIPTSFCRGPWNLEHQHGGPPTAALARALRLAMADDGWRLSRLSFDLLRPVPLAPMRFEVEERGKSRSTWRWRARLLVDDKPLIEAQALALRRETVDLPEVAALEERRRSSGSGGPLLTPPLAPELCRPFVLPIFREREGYHRAFEMRLERGVYGEGPTVTWMRAVIDLVGGEAIEPSERVLVIADSCNGLSPVADPRVITFINADLSANIVRDLSGEWIAVAAQTEVTTEGCGLATGHLYDRAGWIGVAAQTLIVRRASP
jgi:hypothetical protein